MKIKNGSIAKMIMAACGLTSYLATSTNVAYACHHLVGNYCHGKFLNPTTGETKWACTNVGLETPKCNCAIESAPSGLPSGQYGVVATADGARGFTMLTSGSEYWVNNACGLNLSGSH